MDDNINSSMKECAYHIEGMHCASCEILIEKKLLELGNVKSVEASTAKGKVLLEYEGEIPTLKNLNEIFKKEGYVFREISGPQGGKSSEVVIKFSPGNFFTTFGIGLLIIVGFVWLNKLGLASWINVSTKSSLPMFFLFGLIAGISSCAALVGGIILSMSKQWGELYAHDASTGKKIQPHLMFNFGRIVSYGFLGALLGAIGSNLNLSFKFGPFLVILVSVMMIFLALQMLGLKAFRRFQLTMPKFATRFVADEAHFKGRQMPFLMGALTFFLPCGFTITAQGLALVSSSALQGGLIMLLFALGTLPMLLFIGLSSVNFTQRAHLADRFLKVAGILVLFFALFNINNQLNLLGWKNFSDWSVKTNSSDTTVADGLPPIVNSQQIIKMSASSSGYSPNYFKVRAGVPVRWEITDTGTSGCTNAVIARGLFDGEIPLTPGQTSIKEFTPEKAGRYKFSCWMGMVSGVIDVVDSNQAATQDNIVDYDNAFVVSGAESAGGSCGSSGGCGCGGE